MPATAPAPCDDSTCSDDGHSGRLSDSPTSLFAIDEDLTVLSDVDRDRTAAGRLKGAVVVNGRLARGGT